MSPTASPTTVISPTKCPDVLPWLVLCFLRMELVAWVEPWIPVLLTLWGVLFAPVLYESVFLTSSYIVGALNAYNEQSIRQLNKLWWEIPAESLKNWTCTSLMVAPFESFPMLFIVKFTTLLINFFFARCVLSKLPIFLLYRYDVIYCQICGLLIRFSLFFFLWIERINIDMIWFCLLFQNHLINCFSNLHVG